MPNGRAKTISLPRSAHCGRESRRLGPRLIDGDSDRSSVAKLSSRFEIHYTPKHASWLNQAEIAIGMDSRQCLGDGSKFEGKRPGTRKRGPRLIIDDTLPITGRSTGPVPQCSVWQKGIKGSYSESWHQLVVPDSEKKAGATMISLVTRKKSLDTSQELPEGVQKRVSGTSRELVTD